MSVIIERNGGVAVITLNRPERLNALDVTMTAKLSQALDDIAADRTCRVVILTGAGRGFCAGLDLQGFGDEERAVKEGVILAAFGRQQDIARLAEKLHRLPQPVIAAVNGPAAGGGLALVCACDIRIASTGAVFVGSFIRAGYSACDIGVSWLLPRIVGAGRAHELMLTGRKFDAQQALAYGLLTDAVPADWLLEAAMAKAEEIMLNPPASVELTKAGMWVALETPSFLASIEFENRQQMVAAMTADAREATDAFLNKRAPLYEHR